MNVKKLPVTSIVMLAITLILVVYSIWTITNCYDYISEMVAQGQLAYEGNQFNIINYYVTNCSQYILFAILFFVVSLFIHKNSIAQANILATLNKITIPNIASGIAEDDESFNEWLSKQDE